MEELRKRVDNVEYKDIKNLRDKIEQIEINLAENNLLTKQNTEAMNKMSITMDSVRETMIQITSAVEYISSTNKELAENIRQQNEKIDRIQARQDAYDSHMETLKKEINENEEKNKVDIRLFLKKHFIELLIVVALGGIIIEKFIK